MVIANDEQSSNEVRPSGEQLLVDKEKLLSMGFKPTIKSKLRIRGHSGGWKAFSKAVPPGTMVLPHTLLTAVATIVSPLCSQDPPLSSNAVVQQTFFTTNLPQVPSSSSPLTLRRIIRVLSNVTYSVRLELMSADVGRRATVQQIRVNGISLGGCDIPNAFVPAVSGHTTTAASSGVVDPPASARTASGGCHWSLGCILYELASLQAPFAATSLLHVVKRIVECEYEPLLIRDEQTEEEIAALAAADEAAFQVSLCIDAINNQLPHMHWQLRLLCEWNKLRGQKTINLH